MVPACWSFGDTVIGEQDPVTGGYRAGWRMLSTTLVQRGDVMRATTWEAAVPDPGNGERYWTQGMFQAGADGTVTIDSPAGTTPAGIRYQTYSPQLHPEQPLASGKLLISIAWNATDFADLPRDADLYEPRFHEVTLP